jgi:hypothetical protein
MEEHMDYEGVIIEESLKNKTILGLVSITATKAEAVTRAHKTPWLKQWTLHSVTIPATKADAVAKQLSESLDNNYWYADFKNDTTHYIIFPNKIFCIDRTQAAEYQAATQYGLALGIPSYQLDFSPNIIGWKRPSQEPTHKN